MPENLDLKQVIQAVLRYLSIRNRSRQELVSYLEQKKIDSDIIEEAMGYADTHGLINDAGFASEWTSMRVRQGKGDYLIRFELAQKGINTETIDEALSQISDEMWSESMERLLERKHVHVEMADYKDKAAATKYFLQRGYSRRRIDAYWRIRYNR